MIRPQWCRVRLFSIKRASVKKAEVDGNKFAQLIRSVFSAFFASFQRICNISLSFKVARERELNHVAIFYPIIGERESWDNSRARSSRANFPSRFITPCWSTGLYPLVYIPVGDSFRFRSRRFNIPRHDRGRFSFERESGWVFLKIRK